MTIKFKSDDDFSYMANIINNGESDTVEFKIGERNISYIDRDIASFANTNGGQILWGIRDNGEIAGVPLERIGIICESLRKICKSILVDYDLLTIEYDHRYIIQLNIKKKKPNSGFIIPSDGQIYHRVHSQTAKMTLDEIKIALGDSNEIGVEQCRDVHCFVAMSFKFAEYPRLEDFYEAMERAAKNTGLPITLKRVDLEEGDYEISQKLMDMIQECEMFICDFTLSPHNVYFEVGYARALKKYIIQTAENGTTLQFDTRNWRTLFYSNAKQLEAKLISALTGAYKKIVENPE